jgi:hypothetical protein
MIISEGIIAKSATRIPSPTTNVYKRGNPWKFIFLYKNL